VRCSRRSHPDGTIRGVRLRYPSHRSAAALLTLAVAPVAVGLTACSPATPEPDAGLRQLSADLRALDASGAVNGSGIFADQAKLVDAEVLRACGTKDGEPPADCATPLRAPAEAPDVDDVRADMVTLIGDGSADRAVLLTGLHAALVTVEDTDAGGPAVDDDVLDAGFGGAGDKADVGALSRATDLVDQAVYLTGVVLPVAGDSADTVATVGTRLRSLRDAVGGASGVTAAAGYTFSDGQSAPTDTDSGLNTLLQAVHDVTVELRRAVGSVDEGDRATTAMWAAVSARCEAALEDQLGDSPLEVTVRGQ
jgi:hypothetical protein